MNLKTLIKVSSLRQLYLHKCETADSPGDLSCTFCTPESRSRQTIFAHKSATVRFCIIAFQTDSLEFSPLGHTWNLRAFPKQRGVTRLETPSLSVSSPYLFLLALFPSALLLRSRVTERKLSGKPISFSMFSHFYPITACSEVSKATWHFYWNLIKDL